MTKKARKRGPDPETLKIEDDPGEALDRLLGKDQPPTDKRLPKKKAKKPRKSEG